MLAKYLEALYNKVIVSIVVNRSSTNVYVELCSKKGVISSDKSSFETTHLSREMLEYINAHLKESPYFYIALLDNSTEQGAFPSCAKNRLSLFQDLSSSEYKCYDEQWTYYTSKTDLYTLEKRYSKVGIDLLFSPFTLISTFFKDKILTHTAMFILVQETSISLSVFDNGKLLFAKHIDMQITQEDDEELLASVLDDEEIEIEEDVGIDLEEIDVIDDLDDFGDIEDLDSIEDIDQFSQSQDIEEELFEAQEESVSQDEDDEPNEDFQRFLLIQKNVSKYYEDERYEGVFIENTYIADSIGNTADLKRYLEEEMFLNVYIRNIDLGMELAALSKEELGI